MSATSTTPARTGRSAPRAFAVRAGVRARDLLVDRTPIAVAAGLALMYLAILAPDIAAVDENSMFAVGDSIVTGGGLSVPCDLAGPENTVGRGGRCYSIWYPLLSVVAVPFIAAGRALGSAAGVDPVAIAQLLALVVPALAAAAAAGLTAALALALGASRRGSVAAAVAAGLGTELLTYSRTFFAETLIAALVAAAVWGMGRRGRSRRVALAATALVVLAKPVMIVVGPALAVALWLRTRDLRAAAAPAAASAVGVAVYAVYNWARFADPLEFGGPSRFDPDNFVSLELFETTATLLVSPGRGLLWYSPVALVGAIGLWRARREPTAQLAIAVSLAVLLGYVVHPGGGWDWGGRFLVAILPLLCAGLGMLSGRLATLAVVLAAVGFVAQAPNVVGTFSQAYAENRNPPMEEDRWSLANSSLVQVWPAAVHQLQDASRTDVRKVIDDPSGDPRERPAGSAIVWLWWWMLPAAGLSPWLGLAASLLVWASGAVLLIVTARRSPRGGPPASRAPSAPT